MTARLPTTAVRLSLVEKVGASLGSLRRFCMSLRNPPSYPNKGQPKQKFDTKKVVAFVQQALAVRNQHLERANNHLRRGRRISIARPRLRLVTGGRGAERG
jgi:hypothetical protein